MQRLARLRLKEVEALLEKDEYSGAYYLSGYVIECALKACIAKKTKEWEFPDLNTVRKSYTHNLKQLVEVAKVENQLNLNRRNVDFALNWQLVIQWSEESRYKTYSKQEAEDIYSAIADTNHGVLQWIEQYW